MIARARLIVLLTRPPVAVLLALFATIGAEAAGAGGRYGLLVTAFVAVLGYLLFSVAVNDVADQAIDQVNLAGDRRRPLITGAANRRDMIALACAGAGCALGAAAVLGVAVTATTAAGLALSAGYSLRPMRLAERGAVAALVLPGGYVVVPFLAGFFGGGGRIDAHVVVMLAGLYLAFVGRILLKDFRDVRGDALFGKRTFLVRHGRLWTCRFSAVMWAAGAALIAASAGSAAVALRAAYALAVVAALPILHRLAHDPHPRRDERRISALAIVGRGMLVALLAQLGAQRLGFAAPGSAALIAWITALTALQAVTMVRRGPRPQLTTAALSRWASPARAAASYPVPASSDSAQMRMSASRVSTANTSDCSGLSASTAANSARESVSRARGPAGAFAGGANAGRVAAGRVDAGGRAGASAPEATGGPYRRSSKCSISA